MKDMRIRWMITLMLLALASAMVVGCSRVQIGWIETSLPGQFKASYQTFTGTERRRVRLQEGEMLALAYEATVEKGTLAFEVQDPSGESIWSLTLDQEDTGSVDLTAERGGNYRIVVRGEDTGGSFNLNWEVS
jgi:hypothetical protein